MFDVYFVNCLLACSLAFWAGYALASRKWKIILTNMLMAAQVKQRTAVSDLNLH